MSERHMTDLLVIYLDERRATIRFYETREILLFIIISVCSVVHVITRNLTMMQNINLEFLQAVRILISKNEIRITETMYYE